ncbi:hypothetical protein RhiXN_02326 [Rhizoctonia solani]|uniref:Uncharacterized protein n=1 Tax=Rhizoctonia solani TaxID=456999 RepID=A0A8H8T2P9_9AGAM|nr:uncharacterized protein RhiXN_02326 [Rhizoctonia solani]QRW27731.1 hypothetical protein RhiXN_02326 [Rhizoctonia solani]
MFESIGDARAYIRAFFNKYDDFDYDPTKPVMEEFYRMCDHYSWSSEKDKNRRYLNKAREKAGEGFKDALTLQFNTIYGTDENSLLAWQNLCIVLNLGNIPEELNACRDLIRSMYVNIVDLVDVPITLSFVTHFKSEMALSRYTKYHGKYFPLENAYAGGLLKFLLRRIRVPRRDACDSVRDLDSDNQPSQATGLQRWRGSSRNWSLEYKRDNWVADHGEIEREGSIIGVVEWFSE